MVLGMADTEELLTTNHTKGTKFSTTAQSRYPRMPDTGKFQPRIDTDKRGLVNRIKLREHKAGKRRRPITADRNRKPATGKSGHAKVAGQFGGARLLTSRLARISLRQATARQALAPPEFANRPAAFDHKGLPAQGRIL